MEKGRVKNFNRHDGSGTIVDADGQIVNFNSNSMAQRGRGHLNPGEQVWFERTGSSVINIRRC